jgi:hypothetical protein
MGSILARRQSESAFDISDARFHAAVALQQLARPAVLCIARPRLDAWEDGNRERRP